MQIGNRFRCYPTPEQAQILLQWIGCQRYIYNAWPNVGAVQLQDYTIENARSTLAWQGETRAASSTWLRGPGTGTKWMPNHVTAGALTTVDHWGWAITTTPPPTPSCGSTTLT